MRIFVFITLLIIIVCDVSQAETKTNENLRRKPSQDEARPIQFRIVYGEKTTRFILLETKRGGRVDFLNNLGASASKEISTTDYGYLKSKVSKWSGPSNRIEHCTRNYIEVTDRTRKLIGCLGASNKLAREIQEVTNLLSVLF